MENCVADVQAGSPRILIVDDEEANRAILRRLLARRGFNAEEADSGPAALAAVQERRPDMILLDLVMPNMSGLETLHEIRRLHDAITLPVIMVTCENDCHVAAECLSAGANDFVTKPVQWVVLHARIGTHLALHSAQVVLARDRDRLEALIEANNEARAHAGEPAATVLAG